MRSGLTVRKEEIARLCEEFHVQRLEAFGSAVTDDFDPAKSDIDLIVEFAVMPAGRYAAEFFAFKAAMEELLDRSVDLIVASAIRNPYFRESVEQSKTLLYAA